MKIPFRKNPAVSITKSAYAMASSDGVSAEITLYGDIYESQPTDWWGDPVEGQFITLTEFLEDLKQIERRKNVTVRMNSYGGSSPATAWPSPALWTAWLCPEAPSSCAPATPSKPTPPVLS